MGFKPHSRLPSLDGQWLWEFVTLHSGATVLDSHEVPSAGSMQTVKERISLNSRFQSRQAISEFDTRGWGKLLARYALKQRRQITTAPQHPSFFARRSVDGLGQPVSHGILP